MQERTNVRKNHRTMLMAHVTFIIAELGVVVITTIVVVVGGHNCLLV